MHFTLKKVILIILLLEVLQTFPCTEGLSFGIRRCGKPKESSTLKLKGHIKSIYRPGEVMEYECHPPGGKGKNIIQCTAYNGWEEIKNTCDENIDDKPKFFPQSQGASTLQCEASHIDVVLSSHGNVEVDGIIQKTYSLHDSVSFVCKSGYDMEGRLQIQCAEYEGWQTLENTLKCYPRKTVTKKASTKLISKTTTTAMRRTITSIGSTSTVATPARILANGRSNTIKSKSAKYALPLETTTQVVQMSSYSELLLEGKAYTHLGKAAHPNPHIALAVSLPLLAVFIVLLGLIMVNFNSEITIQTKVKTSSQKIYTYIKD